MRATQRVLKRHPCDVGSGDALVELGQLVTSQLPPGVCVIAVNDRDSDARKEMNTRR